MLTFQQWAELNGRRYIGAASFEEFEKNANDYQAYRNNEAAKKREAIAKTGGASD